MAYSDNSRKNLIATYGSLREAAEARIRQYLYDPDDIEVANDVLRSCEWSPEVTLTSDNPCILMNGAVEALSMLRRKTNNRILERLQALPAFDNNAILNELSLRYERSADGDRVTYQDGLHTVHTYRNRYRDMDQLVAEKEKANATA